MTLTAISSIACMTAGLACIAVHWLATRRPSEFRIVNVTRDRRDYRQRCAAAWTVQQRKDAALQVKFEANVRRNMRIRHGARKAFNLEHWA